MDFKHNVLVDDVLVWSAAGVELVQEELRLLEYIVANVRKSIKKKESEKNPTNENFGKDFS